MNNASSSHSSASQSIGCCAWLRCSAGDVQRTNGTHNADPGNKQSSRMSRSASSPFGAGTNYMRWSEEEDHDADIVCKNAGNGGWRQFIRNLLCWPCLLCLCCSRVCHGMCSCDFDEDDCCCLPAASTRHDAASQAAMLQQIEMESRETVLTKACHGGNVHEVADLLNQEDPNKPNRVGDTPLIIASSHGRADLVRLLLEAGADANGRNVEGYTVLMQAAESGSVDVTHELLVAGADATAKVGDGATALYMAARAGQTRVVDELIAHLVRQRQFSFMDAVLRSSLRKARRMGLVDLSLSLVRSGANVNGQDRYGLTPLMVASQQGLSEVVDEMLSLGASPSMVNRAGGDTALTLACSHAHQFKKHYQLTVKLLIDAGANVRHQTSDYRVTPLAFAVSSGNSHIVEQLLAAGAEPNHMDGEGLTPLIRCLGSMDQSQHVGNRARLAVALLGGGADPNMSDGSGKTPLQAVVSRSAAVAQSEILIMLLLQAGADRHKRNLSGRSAIDIDKPDSSYHHLLASYVPALKLQAAAAVRRVLHHPVSSSITQLPMEESLKDFLRDGFLDGLLPALEAAEFAAQQIADRSSTYLGDIAFDS